LEQSEVSTVSANIIRCPAWALGNIVNLATDHDELSNSGSFIPGIDFCLYVDVINCISQTLLQTFEESTGLAQCVDDSAFHSDTPLAEGDMNDNCSMVSILMDLLKPIYQQWHLRKLLMLAKEEASCGRETNYDPNQKQINFRSLKLSDVVCFYYHMLRIFSTLNQSIGALPVLNMLAFTPGFLVDLWVALEMSIFGEAHKFQETGYEKQLATSTSGEHISSMRERRNARDTSNKWANVLHKITGKSNDSEDGNLTDNISNFQQSSDDALTLWDIEAMRQASEVIGNDLMCMLYLFCAIYAHLLLVLDDIEFYEKQVTCSRPTCIFLLYLCYSLSFLTLDFAFFDPTGSFYFRAAAENHISTQYICI
jgi:ubiquitin-protein ligase E3 B